MTTSSSAFGKQVVEASFADDGAYLGSSATRSSLANGPRNGRVTGAP